MAGGGLSLAAGSPYLAGRPCPKCGYVRKASDANPGWQCPQCLVAYAKVDGSARLAPRIAQAGRQMTAHAQSDHTLLLLVATNLVALGIARATGMSLSQLMLVYWVQSVIIGVCAAIRILSLHAFSTEGMTVNERAVEETPAAKWGVGLFFLFHYGFFHAVYLAFLLTDRHAGPPPSKAALAACALAFAFNHGYSLLRNIRADAQGSPSLRTLMSLPYYRIVPMHMTIIFGGAMGSGTGGAMLLFGGLKIAADCLMHTVEHHTLKQGGMLPPAGA